MNVPDKINGCKTVSSVFWNFWRVAGRGLHHENACTCCVFWRGIIVAVAFLTPALFFESVAHKLYAVFAAALIGCVVALINSYIEDEYYD